MTMVTLHAATVPGQASWPATVGNRLLRFRPASVRYEKSRDTVSLLFITASTPAQIKLLLGARLSAAGVFGLGRVVNLAGLYDIGLFIGCPVAIHVNLNYDLVRLAVTHIVRFEAQAVLAAQQGIDRAEY